jgi:hypothetical protein
VLEPVSAARDRLASEHVDHARSAIDDRADRGVSDHVEARGYAASVQARRCAAMASASR